MIKDQLYRRIFIPLAGVAFPFVAGLYSLIQDNPLVIALTVLFFSGVAFFGWQGVVRLTVYLRVHKPVQRSIPLKLVLLTATATVYAAAVFLAATFSWELMVLQQRNSSFLLHATLVGGMGGLLLALVYEVVFLSVEKELDTRVLQQIDKERQEAEVCVLKNELDPHFFFNCMSTLSSLVQNDVEKANRFIHKLSNVYEYLLRNKEKEYVTLQEEMEFLENYYFLLQIRFDDNIRIEEKLDQQNGQAFILPCTLQVLVENAIKHNFFSDKEPLVISIEQNGHFITVSNAVRPKLNGAESTKVGLRNLKARYRLLTNQNILVQKTNNQFLVKLPIVKAN